MGVKKSVVTTSARVSSKRQTAASSGSRRPTNRSGKEAAEKTSWTGRRTCVSASALNLDAQPAQVESVVSRISRPVLGIGMYHQKSRGDRSSPLPCSLRRWRCSFGRCSGGIWQRQDELVACWEEDRLHTRREFENILILQDFRVVLQRLPN